MRNVRSLSRIVQTWSYFAPPTSLAWIPAFFLRLPFFFCSFFLGTQKERAYDLISPTVLDTLIPTSSGIATRIDSLFICFRNGRRSVHWPVSYAGVFHHTRGEILVIELRFCGSEDFHEPV